MSFLVWSPFTWVVLKKEKFKFIWKNQLEELISKFWHIHLFFILSYGKKKNFWFTRSSGFSFSSNINWQNKDILTRKRGRSMVVDSYLLNLVIGGSWIIESECVPTIDSIIRECLLVFSSTSHASPARVSLLSETDCFGFTCYKHITHSVN